ncbi:MAG: hypothetical protein K0U98_14135 [Deltaproteobacteria bacterium]|nr:hypothetical protein [Deltaproteobacteria bacterium]
MREWSLAPIGTPEATPRDLAKGLEEGRSARWWLETLGVLILGGSLYGAAIGLWHGPKLAVYVAVKLPLLLVLTATLTLALNWMAALLFGLRLEIREVAALAFSALSVAAVVLASLTPIALFFTYTVPIPSVAARTTHNLLYLMHTAFVAASGLVGTAALRGTLRRILRRRGADPSRAFKIYALWVTSFAVVGGEVAWALRPFVGSIYHPVVFFRTNALDGNVYEFILQEILPFLLWGES